MIIEETGNVCSYPSEVDEYLFFDEYKQLLIDYNEQYLRKSRLDYKLTGNEIINLFNTVFSFSEGNESCIVCKCKIENTEDGLIYTVYGEYGNFWIELWQSMVRFARLKNIKNYKLKRMTGNENYKDVYLFFETSDKIKKGVKSGDTMRLFSERNGYTDGEEDLTPECTVFKISFKYDDMFDWIKEQLSKYLSYSKDCLTDYYNEQEVY